VSPRRIATLGAFVKPATLLKFHKTLVDRKHYRLFSSRHRRHKPGPKGSSAALIPAIVELKRRNPEVRLRAHRPADRSRLRHRA